MLEEVGAVLILAFWALFSFLTFRVSDAFAARDLPGRHRQWHILALTCAFSIIIGHYLTLFTIIAFAWLLLLLL